MPGIFGGGDDGPSAAEILEKQRKEAERKARDLRGLALRDKNKGVTAQLLGDRSNTSFNVITDVSSVGPASVKTSGVFGKSNK